MSNRNLKAPSSTRILFSGIFVALLLVAYQNCAKGPGSSSGGMSIDPIVSATFAPPAKMSSAVNQDYFFYPVDPSKPFNWPNHYYDVNLQDGIVQRVDDTGKVTIDILNSPYKDSITWGQELIVLMQESSVCKKNLPAPAPGTICTQSISAPHTQVTFRVENSTNNALEEKIYGLGSLTSSCPAYVYDICDSQIANYKQIIGQFLCALEPATCGQ